MRKLALLLMLSVAAVPASAVTKKPAAKKSAKKKPARARHYRAPVVYVSPKVRHVAFEAVSERATQPNRVLDGAGALVPFFEQVSHPQGNGSLHILQYGDSHTASDDWADTMRQALQRKFGAGGPGFTLAGHPFAGYRRFDIRGSNSRGWYTDGLVGRQGDGIYGLGGLSLSTASADETVTMSAECEQVELHYLQQPGGGTMEFSVDGAAVDTIDTDGPVAPGFYQHAPTPGVHEYTVRTLRDLPVRLFGWVAQNRSGVTYETLGINGAQAGLQLDWNEPMIEAAVANREPVLILVAYGTNEALSAKWTEKDYHAAFTAVLRRLRTAAPLASILVVGPPDCEKRLRGRRIPFPHLEEVIDVQRQTALENGCAFWDWRTRMGGPGSVRQWVQAGLSQGDYVHFTSAGYRLIGSMLFDELMAQYNRFLAARTEAAVNGQ
ncbi:MAG TPA: SGNH/GDSL hydrolase family protein [Bryobacteraceae bacterium]|nr:SGNH/GDSL hydrolase family protein [Bryobacteraceae bacterium]